MTGINNFGAELYEDTNQAENRMPYNTVYRRPVHGRYSIPNFC